MQRSDHQQLDFLTTAMPPEMWTLPAELATVDRLLEDPAIVEPLLKKLDPVRGRPPVLLWLTPFVLDLAKSMVISSRLFTEMYR